MFHKFLEDLNITKWLIQGQVADESQDGEDGFKWLVNLPPQPETILPVTSSATEVGQLSLLLN